MRKKICRKVHPKEGVPLFPATLGQSTHRKGVRVQGAGTREEGSKMGWFFEELSQKSLNFGLFKLIYGKFEVKRPRRL